MKLLFKFCAAALMLSACGMVGAADAHGDFVSDRKTHFSRKGQAYYIVGANFWYGGYLVSAGGVGERARLLKELDNMRALGINNRACWPCRKRRTSRARSVRRRWRRRVSTTRNFWSAW